MPQNKNKLTFLCGCGHHHKLKTCTAIQTYYYDAPRGCTEGGDWVPGEIHIICPTTGVRNRVLSDTEYDIPYDKHNDYQYSFELQFWDKVLPKFKETIEEHTKLEPYKFWNNYYFDTNREKFGIKIKGVDYNTKG